MDIYSRKTVGWQVYECESSTHAAELVKDIAIRENINPCINTLGFGAKAHELAMQVINTRKMRQVA